MLLFALSGFAALSWELLWQVYAGLAIGSSAAAVAVTLSVMMTGMTIGAVAGGALLARLPRAAARPFAVLAAVEAAIGVLGLCVHAGFELAARGDAALYPLAGHAAVLVQIALIACVTGPAAIFMGCTIPLMQRVASTGGADVAALYAVNAAGAVAGVLAQTFLLIPALGLRGAAGAAAAVNLLGALVALRQRPATSAPVEAPVDRRVAPPIPFATAATLAFATGLVTFALEVAWFRSLRAAFQSTTDSFALMLAAVLVGIACGSALARRLPLRASTLGLVAVVAATLVVAATPLVRRVDLFDLGATSYLALIAKRVALTLPLIGLPIAAVSCILPALFEASADARRIGRLYGVNTLGCVAGSLITAWWLLPRVGSYRAALLGALALAACGAALVGRGRRGWAVMAVGALVVGGLCADSARTRVQAAELSRELQPIDSLEGADATVSVARDAAGNRQLIIDGFQTSGEAPEGHYMAWMGHLPMLFHPRPERALVICFGTGQTANAVRREGPAHEDVVELSPEVIELAHDFPSNEGVLDDPRVRVHLTDGRSWLRRTRAAYDVVTLEPMEPHFAGTNDLYSLEFYRAVARHLDDDGVVAQWVPLHLLLPYETASVVRTFVEVFPNAALWIDPHDHTGVIIGKKGRRAPIVDGLRVAGPGTRDLDADAIRRAFVLDGDALHRYASAGALITDDDQLLAYGRERHRLWKLGGNAANHELNLRIIRAVASSPKR